MRNKGNLLALLFITPLCLTFNFLGSIAYILNKLGYNYIPFDEVNLINFIKFFIFSMLILIMLTYSNAPINLSEEDWSKINKRILPLYFVVPFFVIYTLLVIYIFGDYILFFSTIVSLCIYMFFITVLKSYLIFKSSFYGQVIEGTKRNFLWQYKIWVTKFEKIPMNRRSANFIFALMGIIVLLGSRSIVPILMLLLFLGKSILSVVDYILGLYTTLDGVCTEIIGGESAKSRRPYWKVYVTDSKRKGELVYTCYEPPYLCKNQEVTVVHGILSKHVLSVNGIWL